MAKDIFSKIIRDYNNELEKILEEKDFTSDVKNLLLSMLYKIENGYDDYKKVKVNVCSKKQFVEEILETIDRRCKKIEFIKPNSEEGQKLYEQKITCIVDRENGVIRTFQNEKSILDAIMQMRQENIKIKQEYKMITTPIKEMLLTGNNINSLELITDFNGWSWDITKSGRKNMTYNRLYQLLVILIGNKQIESWVNNRKSEELEELPSNVILSSKYNESFGITKKEIIGEQKDYIASIREVFGQKYGEKLEDKFFKDMTKVAILECSKHNDEYDKKIKNRIEDLKNKLHEMSDNKKFVENLSATKKEITKNIEQIDKILSSEKEIQKEYEKRNEKLANKDKIFSVSHLKLMLNKERQRKLDEIKSINKKMEPKEFVSIKNDLEEKLEFYQDVNIEDKSKENTDRLIKNLEKTFLKCFKIKIENVHDNKTLENLIYELRYYQLAITISKETTVASLEKLLIKKASEQKILIKVSEDEKTNYLILKEIFTSKVIDLDTLAFVLKYSKGIIAINIYDGNTNDEIRQVRLTEKTELCVKLNKKIKIWQ